MAESEEGTPHPRSIFDTQAAALRREPVIPYEKRIQLLETIERLIVENDEAICEAISRDFGNRSKHETRILEISGSLLGLRYTRKRLKRWMAPQRRHVSILFAGSRNRVIPQAKGIVGIVTPWNYPLFLAISPMTSAIAAGNRVMVKLASNSQRLCRLLHRLFSNEIDGEYICFLPGAGASEFSGLPFNHLVFTGSPDVGKTVMKTAAATLTPVTLELGGKSPTVIAEDYPLEKAVARIMYAKLMNAGQTCIAPDYLFVPQAKLTAFIHAAKAVVAKRYPDIRSRDYTSIIDERAFARLTETLKEAQEKGARLINLLDGPQTDPELRKISPTLVTGVSRDMRIMKEEIFGPLFPVMPYSDPEEVIDYINSGERPLALYLFTKNRRLTEQVLARTISGGVTINDCAMHVAQHDIPFGGIGNSGMGHYHGYEGFAEFSKLKPVFRQSGAAISFAPPYGPFIGWIYRMVKQLRWLA
ncbi:MAG: coniferyl aldehyde dehydrogenase [Desulfobacterales bacterium]|nr:coniferyl aldehyde dehydrogenase [Desulfobacterales bacterium]